MKCESKKHDWEARQIASLIAQEALEDLTRTADREEMTETRMPCPDELSALLF